GFLRGRTQDRPRRGIASASIPNMIAVGKPALHYNNFGYTLGGPVYIPGHYNVKRDKTFFLFRRISPGRHDTFVQGTVPTAAEKAGTFTSPVCVATTSAGVCTQTSTQITNINPIAAEYIKDIWAKVPDGNASH